MSNHILSIQETRGHRWRNGSNFQMKWSLMVNYSHLYRISLWFKAVLNTEQRKTEVTQSIRGSRVQPEPGNPLCSLNPLWENEKKWKILAGSAVGELTPTRSWSTSRADSLTSTNTHCRQSRKIMRFLNMKSTAAKKHGFGLFPPVDLVWLF